MIASIIAEFLWTYEMDISYLESLPPGIVANIINDLRARGSYRDLLKMCRTSRHLRQIIGPIISCDQIGRDYELSQRSQRSQQVHNSEDPSQNSYPADGLNPGDLNPRDQWIRQFINAAKTGNLKVIKQLLHEGDVDMASLNQALVDAAAGGYLNVVNFLIQFGAQSLYSYPMALDLAALNGHRNVVERLLEFVMSRYDINNAMESAASRGHRDIVERMLQLGANNYDEAIEAADEGNHQDIVNLLHAAMTQRH
jgi:hypothetical protein